MFFIYSAGESFVVFKVFCDFFRCFFVVVFFAKIVYIMLFSQFGVRICLISVVE